MAMALTIDYNRDFPFYRCGGKKTRGCGRLITFLEERERLRTGDGCSCGCRQYQPADPKPLDYLKPKYWRMVRALRGGEITCLPQ